MQNFNLGNSFFISMKSFNFIPFKISRYTVLDTEKNRTNLMTS